MKTFYFLYELDDGTEVEVGFDAYEGSPAVMYPNDAAHPEEPPEIEVFFLEDSKGRDIFDKLSEDDLAKIESACWDYLELELGAYDPF